MIVVFSGRKATCSLVFLVAICFNLPVTPHKKGVSLKKIRMAIGIAAAGLALMSGSACNGATNPADIARDAGLTALGTEAGLKVALEVAQFQNVTVSPSTIDEASFNRRRAASAPQASASTMSAPGSNSAATSGKTYKVLLASVRFTGLQTGCSVQLSVLPDHPEDGWRFVKVITPDAPQGTDTNPATQAAANPNPAQVFTYLLANHPGCLVQGATPPGAASPRASA